MPTTAWMVYGEGGDTILLSRTSKGKVRVRLVLGERVVGGVFPMDELGIAVEQMLLHEAQEHCAKPEED